VALFPNGKQEGNNWCVGDISGSPGKSFKIAIQGTNAGMYKDFANESDKGDLIKLWMEKCNTDFKGACKDIGSLLGVEWGNDKGRPIKTVSNPTSVAVKQQYKTKQLPYLEWWYDYFKERGISADTISKAKLEETECGKLCYPVYDEDGKKVLYRKYQARERNEKGKKKVFQDSGITGKQCLIGKQCLDPESKYIVITEGEEDWLTALGIGWNALTIPQGGPSNSWIENDYDFLMQFDDIYLCFDMDQVGQDATDDAIKRLGIDKCKIVELPEKDLNDCWMNGCDKDELERILLNAKVIIPEKLRDVGFYEDECVRLADPLRYQGTESPFPKLEFKQREGELTIWTGWSSHGKTMVLSQWIINEIRNDKKAMIASMEVAVPKAINLMAKQITGQVNQQSIEKTVSFLHNKLWFYDNTGVADKNEMIEAFIYARKRYNVRVFVIDSLCLCGVSEKDIDEQKDFVQRLRDFVDIHQSHLHLVAHSGKNDTKDESKMPTKFDVRGGVAITDIAFNGITVFRNKKTPEERKEGESDSIIKCWKQRENGIENFVKCKYNSKHSILEEV